MTPEILGRYERHAAFTESSVVLGIEARIDIDEVVGVPMGDHQRVDVGDADVLLQPRERPGTGVHPEVEPVVTHQVAAGGARGPGPRPAGTEDGQFHVPPPTGWAWAARTSKSSGPKKTSARRWNIAGSPVAKNS